MSNGSVSVNFQGIYNKLSEKSLKRGQYATVNQMLGDMNKFVPADNYILRNTGYVANTGDKIVWNTPYSRAQFYGDNGIVTFKKYTTPGTGARWDLKAKSLFMNDWIQIFAKGVGL